MKNQDLEGEARLATELLQGKVVRIVWRHRTKGVGIEFADGTRLFVDVDRNGEIELSITGGASDDRR
jgi:hypothetical protein